MRRPRSGDADGAVVASRDVAGDACCPASRPSSGSGVLLAEPALWSPDSPSLYTAAVDPAGRRLERSTTTPSTFGIRTLPLDPRARPADQRRAGASCAARACTTTTALLGAATIGRAEERRVELLKAAGFNALRSAHNPMSRAMLDACDRLGVLVMDELTDMWTEGKTDFDARAATSRSGGSATSRRWCARTSTTRA